MVVIFGLLYAASPKTFAAGLVAAAGWTGLASYAVYTTGTEMVTRD